MGGGTEPGTHALGVCLQCLPPQTDAAYRRAPRMSALRAATSRATRMLCNQSHLRRRARQSWTGVCGVSSRTRSLIGTFPTSVMASIRTKQPAAATASQKGADDRRGNRGHHDYGHDPSEVTAQCLFGLEIRLEREGV